LFTIQRTISSILRFTDAAFRRCTTIVKGSVAAFRRCTTIVKGSVAVFRRGSVSPLHHDNYQPKLI